MPGVYTNTWHRSLNLEIQVDLGDKNVGASLSALLTAFETTYQKWRSRFPEIKVLKWVVKTPNPSGSKFISICSNHLLPSLTAGKKGRRWPPAKMAGDDRRSPAIEGQPSKWKLLGGQIQFVANSDGSRKCILKISVFRIKHEIKRRKLQVKECPSPNHWSIFEMLPSVIRLLRVRC